jgi:hypothetical protein
MKTCKKICRHDRSFWMSEVNRGVSHHSGWLPLLLRGGFLKKCKRGKLQFSGSGRYSVVPFKKSHVGVLRSMGTMCAIVQGHSVPRTLAEWAALVKAITIEARKRGAMPQPANRYTFLWFLRTYWIAEMRLQSKTAWLQCKKTDQSRVLAQAFPDSSGWLPRLTVRYELSVLALTRLLRYDGPLEYLTMFLCVLGCKELMSLSDGAVERLCALRPKRSDAQNKNGEPFHPATVARRVLQATVA